MHTLTLGLTQALIWWERDHLPKRKLLASSCWLIFYQISHLKSTGENIRKAVSCLHQWVTKSVQPASPQHAALMCKHSSSAFLLRAPSCKGIFFLTGSCLTHSIARFTLECKHNWTSEVLLWNPILFSAVLAGTGVLFIKSKNVGNY